MDDEMNSMPDPEAYRGDRKTAHDKTSDPEIAHAAQHIEIDDDLKKDHMNYDRVDKEVAKYASVRIPSQTLVTMWNSSPRLGA
jgi:hypothetical protein